MATTRRQAGTPIGRQAILDAALHLYSEGDYSSVTMRAIAQAVGCQSPSLYHYFASKDDIFQALEEAGVALILAHYTAPEREDAGSLEKLRTRYWRYYSFSRVHPDYFRLLFLERFSPQGQAFRKQVMESVESGRRVTACIADGSFPANTDRVAAAQLLWSAVHGPAVLGLRAWDMGPSQTDVMAARGIELTILAIQAGLDFVGSAEAQGRIWPEAITGRSACGQAVAGRPSTGS